jgi:hypothetical protein
LQREGLFFHSERETAIPTAVITSMSASTATSSAIPTTRKVLSSIDVLCIITSSSDGTSTQSLCISYILVFMEHGGISYIVTIGVHNSTINNYIIHTNNSISENISSFINHGSSSATFTDANTNTSTMIWVVCSYILI